MSKSRMSIRGRKTIFIIGFTLLLVLVIILFPSFTKTVEKESMPVINNGNYEIPAVVSDHQVVVHPGYSLSYNEDYEVADWVAYVIDEYELNTKVTGLSASFREDSDIITESAHLSDYKGSGFYRGQLLSSANRTSSVEFNEATFLLSNVAPMSNRFSIGLLQAAEKAERDVARQYKKAYIVTGPVFSNDMQRIGDCDVAVPKAFYKVILVFDEKGHAYSIGMILPQDYEDGKISKYLCSVNEVEKATGLDFFILLPDEIEEKIENQKDIYKWPASMR